MGLVNKGVWVKLHSFFKNIIPNKSKMITMASKKEAVDSNEELVTVYGTGNSRHMAHGAEFQVPQAEADHLVNAGHASLTEPKKKEKNHTAGPNDHKK
jgi:hypothetical protein